MDLRFLESLLAVIESGSIAAAARQQGLTAAAVGQRIKALESDLGVTLLQRSGHRAQPTQAALKLLPRARHLLQEARAMRGEAGGDGLEGRLRLGAISTMLTDEVPGLLARLSEKAPDARLEIHPGTSAVLYDRLQKRELDGILTVAPPFELPKNIALVPVMEQAMMLVSRAPGRVEPREIIARNPLILYDRKAWGGRAAWDWLTASGSHPNIFCEMDSPETIAILVDQGMGVALLPDWRGLRQRHPDLTCTEIEALPARRIVLMSLQPAPAEQLLTLVAQILRGRDRPVVCPPGGGGE